MNGVLFRSSSSVNVIQQLRYDIITGVYPDGYKLTEAALCLKYKISRVPIRAILQQLDSEGLIKTMPNGCRVVIGITASDVLSLCSLCSYIEISAVQTILGSSTDRSPLVPLLEEMESQDISDTALMLKTHITVHRLIIELSRNRYFISMFNVLAPALYTVFLASIEYPLTKQFISDLPKLDCALLQSLIYDKPDECVSTFLKHHEKTGLAFRPYTDMLAARAVEDESETKQK